MIRFKNKAVAILLATVSIVGIGLGVSYAPALAQSGSNALSVVPRKDYTIEPGKSVEDTLVVKNLDSKEPLHLNLRVIDFTFRDQTGTAELMLDEDAEQTTWSLKPFLDIPEKVTVQPRETVTLDIGVEIPEGHGAGSYYSAIVYSTVAGEEGHLGVSASSTTLVFTSIPGDVNENLELEKLGAFNPNAQRYSFFNNSKPGVIGYTLKNEGNVTQAPLGTITLKHTFGHEVTINDINPTKSLALIGQSRTFESCIKLKRENVDFEGTRSEAASCDTPTLWPGRYSVNMAAFYGQNGNVTQELNGKGSFWYLPWWFVITVLAIAAIGGYYIWKASQYIKLNKQKSGKSKRSSRRK